MKRIPVHHLDPASAPDGYAPIVSGGKFILDDPGGGIGLPWFEVTTYGAIGDGTANDTAAINAAIAALNTAGRGVLYFPAGTYKCTSALTTITAHANIFGDGAGDLQAQNAASTLKITATTGYLMTLAGDGTVVENIAFENPTTTTQTAGAAIRVTQGDLNRYRNISVRGFYDCIDIEDGALWTMEDCYLVGPVRYCLYVRHIDLVDGGDQKVTGCSFYAEDRNAVAAVRWETGGGLRFTDNKINTLYGTGFFTYGFNAHITAVTGVCLVEGNSIENVTSESIYCDIAAFCGMQGVVIAGNEIGYYAGATTPAITVILWNDIIVTGNTIIGMGGSYPSTGINLNTCARGWVGVNNVRGFASEYVLTSCTGVQTIGGEDLVAEAERIRDVIGAALVQGTGITITVNDPGDSITIAATATGSGLRPLTTESGGVPDLVWDDNNELVMTEAPG